MKECTKSQTGDKRLRSQCHLQAVSALLTISENQFFRWPINFYGSPVTCSWQQPDHVSDRDADLCSLRQVYDVACISLGPCGHEDNGTNGTAGCVRGCANPHGSQSEYKVDIGGWSTIGCRIGLGSSAKKPSHIRALIFRPHFWVVGDICLSVLVCTSKYITSNRTIWGVTWHLQA